MEDKKTNAKLISISVLVAVVILVVVVAMIDNRDKKASAVSAAITSSAQTTNTSNDTATLGIETPAAAPTVAAAYKAGTYTAEGTYQTPDENDTIKITVSISTDGVITDTSAVAEGSSFDSQEYQSRFISGYKSKVIGKNIATLKLGNVSGSSLTPIGFNEAIATIATKAKA